MKKIEPFGYVYETVNLINNKKYIGKCKIDRINNHENYLGSGTYLKRAINKYGKENFIKNILEYAYSEDELNYLEEKYILERNAVFSDDYYNLKYDSIGGDVFTNHPEKESIRNKRKLQMGGFCNHQFDKEKSSKMINSVRESNSKKIKIDGIDYESTTVASEILGIGISTICYRLSSKHFDNYLRLVNDSKVARSKVNKKNKPILIKIDEIFYDSIAHASRVLEKSPSYIKFRLNSDDFPNYIILNDLNK